MLQQEERVELLKKLFLDYVALYKEYDKKYEFFYKEKGFNSAESRRYWTISTRINNNAINPLIQLLTFEGVEVSELLK